MPHPTPAHGSGHHRSTATRPATPARGGAPVRPPHHPRLGNRAVAGLVAAQRRTGDRLPPVVLQRLMGHDDFVRATPSANDSSIFSKGRNKILPVDRALTAYHQVDIDEPAEKHTRLLALEQACLHYLGKSDKSAKRKDGVRTLHAQILIEKPLIQRVVDAVAGLQGLDLIEALITVQDEFVREAMDGASSRLFLAGIGKLMSVTTNRLTREQKTEFMTREVGRLQAMSRRLDVPTVTRAVIREIVANIGKADLTTGPAGAGFRNAEDGPTYFVMNNPNKSWGSGERLGSLAHELTHISLSESYENTKMMWAFLADLPDEQVRAKSTRRVRELDELLTLVDGIPQLLDAQKNLIRGQLEYAKRDNLMADEAALDEGELTRFRKLNGEGVNWSSLVEFDTNINQCLIYMATWGVPPAQAFHAKLIKVAGKAFSERALARKG